MSSDNNKFTHRHVYEMYRRVQKEGEDVDRSGEEYWMKVKTGVDKNSLLSQLSVEELQSLWNLMSGKIHGNMKVLENLMKIYETDLANQSVINYFFFSRWNDPDPKSEQDIVVTIPLLPPPKFPLSSLPSYTKRFRGTLDLQQLIKHEIKQGALTEYFDELDKESPEAAGRIAKLIMKQ